MKLPRRCCALVLVLLSAGNGLAASLEFDDLGEPRSITGEWLYMTGDDPGWADPGLEDGGWLPVTVPGPGIGDHPDAQGMVWYRVHVRFGPPIAADLDARAALGVAIGSVESAYEIYAGGRLLGGMGKLPPEPVAHFDQHGIYPIPLDAVDADGNLVLALRVWRHERAASRSELGHFAGPFRVGSIGDLRAEAVLAAIIPNVLLAGVYLMVGLYHLFVARRNPSMREFFWFGWMALILAAYSVETSQWKYTIDLPFLVHKKIEYVVLYLGPVVMTETFARIAAVRLNIFWRVIQAVFVGYAALVLLIPNIDIHYLTLTSFQYLAAIWTLGIVGLMGWHAFKGNREARSISGLMILFFFAVLTDVILDIKLLGANNLLHLMFALVVLLMAVLMANRYTATLAKLERTVEDHTADLREANLRLERASAAKSQFLANMSHELRTPMNAIIGLTHLGLKTELSDQQREYLTTVDHSAQGLLGIIESILDFSDLDGGEVTLDEQVFNIADVLERQAAIAGPAAQEKGLDLQFHGAANLPVALVGDPRRLGQVLAVFIGNAIKFTDRGSIRVEVGLASATDDTASLEFSVTDSGPGMSAEEQKHLFDPFSQADESHTRTHGGTGLGLAVASKLAALMDARIDVSSEPGRGSTFSLVLTLPLATDDAGGGPDSGTDAVLDLGPIRGARVLLVDDSEINLQVASEILRQIPVRVEVAHDGQEAVTMTESHHYDCVLMDVQMPVMDGYAATEAIRAGPLGEDLPILAMTANVAPEDQARAKAAGMNAHIAKPIDPDRLFRELLTWIEPGEREPIEPELAVEPASLAELPDELPGIRVGEGLARVGGNVDLYVSLLKDLARDYADCHTQLGELLGAGATQEAAALAHKLKGIANNLGVVGVGTQAAALESALRSAEPVSESALQNLAEALAESSTAIEQLVALQSAAEGGGEESGGNSLELLDRLEKEIGENDPAASDTAEELLKSLEADSAAVTAATAARDALELFDFAGAGEQLDQIRAGLGS